MSANADKRAADLALGFASTILRLVAQRLDTTPGEVLAAASARGQTRDPEVLELRAAFGRLASRCFPEATYPPRKLRDLCRGDSTPTPLWQVLAGLERGLEVTAADLFALPSGPALAW